MNCWHSWLTLVVSIEVSLHRPRLFATVPPTLCRVVGKCGIQILCDAMLYGRDQRLSFHLVMKTLANQQRSYRLVVVTCNL